MTGPKGAYVYGAPTPGASSTDIFLTGKCKWFNAEKRFGFIDIHGEDGDIFVHYRDIHSAPGVEATLAEGEYVEFRRSVGPEGKLRAVEVTGPEGAYVQGREPVTSGRLTGCCRWFDIGKGYGFLDVDGEDEAPAFVHHKDLYAAGVQSLAHGEKGLEFRCVLDPNGRRKAIEVTGKEGSFVQGAARITAKEWAAVWDAARWFSSGDAGSAGEPLEATADVAPGSGAPAGGIADPEVSIQADARGTYVGRAS